MRLVFYVVGLCYMLGLLFTVIVGTSLAFYFVPLICLLAVLCVVFNKNSNKTEVAVGLLCVALGILTYSFCYNTQVEPVKQLESNTAKLTATIIEESYCKNSRYYYFIESNSIAVNDVEIDNLPQNVKLKIFSEENFEFELYENIELEVKFNKLKKSPYYYHNVSDGYYIGATLVKNTVKPLGSKTVPWYSFLNDIHKGIENKLSSVLDRENCGLLMALMLGDKSDMDKTIQNSFTTAGVSHIVVVSGLHLSIIIGFVFSVLSLFIKEKKITAGVTIVIILMYVVVTGFTYSVIRCAVMNIIYLCSYFVKRRPDSLNSLGFAGLIITLKNPLAIGNLGLIMSFSATLGIITVEEKLRSFILDRIPEFIKTPKLKIIKRIVEYVVSCISVSLSATLFTLPVMVYVFESFKVYFLLSNLLITAVVPVIIVVGIIITVMLYIPFLSALAGLIAIVENYLCSFVIWVTEFVSDLPMATISLSSVTVKLATFVVIAVIAIFFIAQGFKIKSLSFCVAISCSVYAMVMSLGYFIMSQSFSLQIIDTGSGVTIIEDSPDGVNILCCGGDIYHSNNAITAIENKRLNSIIIPDYRKYYSKYAEDYIYEFDFENILVYDTDKYSEFFTDLLKSKNVTYIMENTTVDFANYQYKIITADNKNWLYITSENSSVLVSPKNADCAKLPLWYRKCEVLVLQTNCVNVESITCDNIVFCGKDNGKGYYYTENGDIMIYKFLNGSVSLWQS